jgi:murein DD-endopeptidase MepM/ murein hydrolase activator NlpD
MPRLRLFATTALAALAVALPRPAAAQEALPEASTTSTTDPAALPAPAGATPVDPGATTTTTAPADDPAAHADAPSETVPVETVTVPPRAVPAGGSYAGQDSFADHPGRVVRVSARTARARAAESQAVLDDAVERRDMLAARRMQLRATLADLAVEEREAVEAVEAAQLAFEERAADAYIRGSLTSARALIGSSDAGEFAQRLELLEVVVEGDERALRLYRAARAAVDDEQVGTATELAEVSQELLAAEDAVRAATFDQQLAARELAVYVAGGSLVIHGFVFPVAQPHQFGDSFGAPRMTGTEHEHWHEGTDIMAPMGTLLLACERGVIIRIGTGGVLGGNTVWLRGESGTAYYYAHLSSFAPGLAQGMVVDAGTVLGSVGDTGNARGGLPHLHFEVHPGGGGAINPYPILAVADDQSQPEPVWIQQP